MNKPEHTIIVAFVVHADTRDQAQRMLMPMLPRGPVAGQLWEAGGEYIDSWWIAEDDRLDGSDCDSAVFVPMGTQSWRRAVVEGGGRIPCHNRPMTSG